MAASLGGKGMAFRLGVLPLTIYILGGIAIEGPLILGKLYRFSPSLSDRSVNRYLGFPDKFSPSLNLSTLITNELFGGAGHQIDGKVVQAFD